MMPDQQQAVIDDLEQLRDSSHWHGNPLRHEQVASAGPYTLTIYNHYGVVQWLVDHERYGRVAGIAEAETRLQAVRLAVNAARAHAMGLMDPQHLEG